MFVPQPDTEPIASTVIKIILVIISMSEEASQSGGVSAHDRTWITRREDLCGLTFEVRRDRQQAAWPGRKDDKPHLQAGPSGLLLGLASTEGLGRTLHR